MTHPTIEIAKVAALVRMQMDAVAPDIQEYLLRGNPDLHVPPGVIDRAIAYAARVILAAEPSQMEIDAAIQAWHGPSFEECARSAIKAANAAKAKEMGL